MPSKLAAQMFTLREFTKTEKDFAESLEKVKTIGYNAVQLSAVGCMNGETPDVSAERARKLMDDNGLKCIATHRGWQAFVDDIDAEIAFHQALGCDYAAIGGLPGDMRKSGAEGFRKFAQATPPVIQKLKEAGITFGYHNHAFEFFRYADGPKTGYDIFIEEAPEMALEIDTYWVVHAGADPISIIERAPGRVPVVHMKDKEVVDGESIIAPVGEGNLNWDGIIAACEEAGTNWYAVEQDRCLRDPFDCLKSSFNYLTSKGI